MKLCGLDEAGRGPIIGPLVVAGVAVDESMIPQLKEIGVKDSKMLTKIQRESMFEQIKAISHYHILIVEPEEIDAALNHPELNLNWLEGLKMAEIINELEPEKAIIDAPSNNIPAFTEFLKKQITNKDIQLTLEHKADEKYEVCSAASILAKVTRDREIERIKDKVGDCGSGYPSDPKTKEFVEKEWNNHKEIFRTTWATYKRFANEKKQKSLADY